MSDANGKCDCCGRFMSPDGATWAMIYDFAAMEPKYERYHCKACTESYGPAQSNARPHDGNMGPYQGYIAKDYEESTP